MPMDDTFVTVEEIAEQWSLDTGNARTAVFTELGKIKGPMQRQNPSGARVLGLTAKQFENASAQARSVRRGGSGQARETGPA